MHHLSPAERARSRVVAANLLAQDAQPLFNSIIKAPGSAGPFEAPFFVSARVEGFQSVAKSESDETLPPDYEEIIEQLRESQDPHYAANVVQQYINDKIYSVYDEKDMPPPEILKTNYDVINTARGDNTLSSPLRTARSGRGECEDLASLKMEMLRRVGIPEDKMAVAMGEFDHTPEGEGHAVLLVQIDGQTYVLDHLMTDVMGAYEGPEGDLIYRSLPINETQEHINVRAKLNSAYNNNEIYIDPQNSFFEGYMEALDANRPDPNLKGEAFKPIPPANAAHQMRYGM
jgi:hypothetical protein